MWGGYANVATYGGGDGLFVNVRNFACGLDAFDPLVYVVISY